MNQNKLIEEIRQINNNYNYSKYNLLDKILSRRLLGDKALWFIIFALFIVSIIVVYSSIGTLAYRKMHYNTEYYLFKHFIYILLSLFCVYVTHHINYKHFVWLSKMGVIVSVILLISSLIGGINIHGANRWIELFGFSFQPSDLAQVVLITRVAHITSKIDEYNANTNIKKIYILCVLICGLISISHFSRAIVLFTICMIIMFVGCKFSIIKKLILINLGLISALVLLTFLFGQRWGTVLFRIKNFINPSEIPYQLEQSYIAIANGQMFGIGIGKSVQCNFLPYSYADYIYPIIIEEFGSIGGIFILFLYLFISIKSVSIAKKSNDIFAKLLVLGLGFLISITALINMAMSTGLIPITGLPIPFLSMGGTALLFSSISLGMIQSVSNYSSIESNKYI